MKTGIIASGGISYLGVKIGKTPSEPEFTELRVGIKNSRSFQNCKFKPFINSPFTNSPFTNSPLTNSLYNLRHRQKLFINNPVYNGNIISIVLIINGY